MPKQMYLATLSEDAPALAQKYALGLELDHFCTAVNMDREFECGSLTVTVHFLASKMPMQTAF